MDVWPSAFKVYIPALSLVRGLLWFMPSPSFNHWIDLMGFPVTVQTSSKAVPSFTIRGETEQLTSGPSSPWKTQAKIVFILQKLKWNEMIKPCIQHWRFPTAHMSDIKMMAFHVCWSYDTAALLYVAHLQMYDVFKKINEAVYLQWTLMSYTSDTTGCGPPGPKSKWASHLYASPFFSLVAFIWISDATFVGFWLVLAKVWLWKFLPFLNHMTTRCLTGATWLMLHVR